MRTCKEWMDSPRTNHRTYTESSSFLCPIIRREMRNAPNRAVLNRRHTIMSTNLRLMFEHEELSGPSYSCLKIILRGEYEDRWNELRKDGSEMDDIITLSELRDRLRGVRSMDDFLDIAKDIYADKEKYGIEKKNDIYLLFIYVLNDMIDNLERMI